jgi:fructosamine-3-kinase
MDDEAARTARLLQARLSGAWSVQALHASGFCATWRARQAGRPLFVKSLPIGSAEVLEAEADGLRALARTRTVRVPAVIACVADEALGIALLALEWLDLRAPERSFGERFGRALGALHRAACDEAAGRFGWHRDNRLGATPQRNRWSREGGLAGWIEFFGRERLGAMADALGAAPATQGLADTVRELLPRLPRFFDDGHVPRSSLIHGDLWSGNWGMLADGTPVIYDPAVSCSEAEAELAMMELFGQPPSGFWAAYRAEAGLHAGYERRRGLYQLYHLLNHALLFGGGYVPQSLALAESLLALSASRARGSSPAHRGR